jgi:hypothetical protein
MSTAVVVVATLLAASLGATAKSAFASAPQQDAAQEHHSVTVTGCLAARQAGGPYILTESSGIAYEIAGDTSLLQGKIEHEIAVTGQLSSETPASGRKPTPNSGVSANSSAPEIIRLENVKSVAGQCDFKAPRSGSRDQSTYSGGQHLSKVSESAADERASNEPNGATVARQLPQTSTILPLLGLIGLGSLVAGFFARK